MATAAHCVASARPPRRGCETCSIASVSKKAAAARRTMPGNGTVKDALMLGASTTSLICRSRRCTAAREASAKCDMRTVSRSAPTRLQASRALRRATRGGILGGAQLTAVAQLVSGGSRIKGAVLQARASAPAPYRPAIWNKPLCPA